MINIRDTCITHSLLTFSLELLQKNGLSQSGKKEELIERLVKHDQQTVDEFASLDEEFGDLGEYDDSKLGLEYVKLTTRSFYSIC